MAAPHEIALAIGNMRRLAKGDFHKYLKSVDPSEQKRALSRVINNPPNWILNASVVDELKRVKGWSPTTVEAYLVSEGVSPWATVGKLTVRQRTVIKEALLAWIDMPAHTVPIRSTGGSLAAVHRHHVIVQG